ncbi:MAG: FliM/FliN family flagellar motor switch protein [Deltaproteobacteria bacterium]|nr:FliM/FliN family flagellar motor switch protein [Deltaproteobacteria bacterium]MBI2975261.1 FliM/FliN family flagellar motor switch protein [Deltaproteobacteria bacterium]
MATKKEPLDDLEGKDVFDEIPEEKEEDELEDDLPIEEDSAAKETARMTSDVPVQIVAVMAKKTISVKELVSLKTGQVINLARPANEVIDLVAGGKLIAKGELVDIDGKLGVRIVKMVR